MKPHSRKDTSLSASSFSETRPLTTRSLMQTSKKDMHANALSARQSIERDPRNLKTSRIVTDSATPAVCINLMLGTMKVDHSKRNNTTRNSTIQQQASQSSPAKTLTPGNRKHRTSTIGIARSSLTIQLVQPPKERNASKSGSKIKRSDSKKEENITQSTYVSPQKIEVEQAETNKIPVFPSKCNELSGKTLTKSASENKLLTASTISQKPGGSFFENLKEEKSKMSVSSANPTAKKKQNAQKILRKNLASVSQSAKKESASSSQQAKIKNKANKTHRVQVSTLDTASQIDSIKSLQEDIPSIEASPLLQPAIPSGENQPEAKAPASLRPTRSLTSLKAAAGQKREQTPTLTSTSTSALPPPQQEQQFPQFPQQPKTTPQTSTKKVASSKSRTDIDNHQQQQSKGGYSNAINTPSMSTDRLSPRIAFTQQPKVDPLSLKTTYFRPIEDTKLTEYIQSIRNSQKQTSKFEYRSTECLLQEEPQKDSVVSSFSTTLQSLPAEQAIQTERNILINKDINVEKRAETLPEQIMTQRFESTGAYRSNIKESPTNSAQKPRYGNKKSESSFNYMVQTARERPTKKKDTEQYRERKHEKFYEIPRENLIKSARYNSDENGMFSNESTTIRGLQRSVVTRGPGDKLSPTSTFMRNHGGGSEREINNFSKLDQLLKNFKDEKLEKNRAEREKKDQAWEDGLFAPSIGDADEEPSAMLSNLRKSLARILIVKNE